MILFHFPDVEHLAVGFLRAALAVRPEPFVTGVQIGTRVPKNRIAPFVQVRNLGGGAQRTGFRMSRIDAYVYHSTAEYAQSLASICLALLLSRTGKVVDGWSVVRAEHFAGPVDFPDPLTDAPRYLVTVEWTLRGQQENG